MKWSKSLLAFILTMICCEAMQAHAQFQVTRSAFGNGGGVSESNGLRLKSTVSQNFIGAAVNGEFANLVGFWYQKPIDIPTGVEDGDSDIIPASYRLEQNYPNPMNPSTNIRFALPKAGRVSLRIYNILGQKVATLVDLDMEAGTHKVVFDAGHLPSGMYLYRLQAGEFTEIRKLTLLK